MNLINLTPHNINVIDGDGILTTIPPTTPAARITTSYKLVGHVNGFPINVAVYDLDAENLPEPAEDTMYIVSTIVASTIKRQDLIAPDTGKTAVRDESGQIVAVRGFVQF